MELPLKSTFQVYNGNEKQKYYLKIANYKIPIWGFGKIEFKEYETESNEKRINFIKWELPVSFISETHREKEEETRIYSKEEAFQVAKEMAKADIKSRLPEDAIIKGENVLHQSIDSGKVYYINTFPNYRKYCRRTTNYSRRVGMTEDLKTINVQLKNSNEAIALIGNADANLKVIEQELDVSIITRGETVYVSGDLEHVEIVGSIIRSFAIRNSKRN